MKRLFLILVLITSIVFNAKLYFTYTSIPGYEFMRMHIVLSYISYAFWLALIFYSIEDKKPIVISLLFLIPIIFNFGSNIFFRIIFNITPINISTILNITSYLDAFIVIIVVVLNLMYSKKPTYLIILFFQILITILVFISNSILNYRYLISIIRDLLILLFLFIEIFNRNKVKENNDELVL